MIGSRSAFRLAMLVGCSMDRVSRGDTTEFYALLAELNKDVIRSVHCKELSQDTHEVRMDLESIAPAFGIPRKTMTLVVQVEVGDGMVVYRGATPPREEGQARDDAEVLCDSSHLVLSRTSSDVTAVEYHFDVDFNEDLPIFMEDAPGLLMKKVFVRLKNYLDNTVR